MVLAGLPRLDGLDGDAHILGQNVLRHAGSQTNSPNLLRVLVRDGLNRHLPRFRGKRALLERDRLFQPGIDLVKNAHY